MIDGTIPAGGAAGVAGTNPGNGGDLIVRHKRGGSTLWTGTLQGGRAGINANAGTAVNAASGGSAGSGWDRAKNGRSSEGGLLIGSYPTKAGPGANAPFDFGDGGKAGTGAGDDGQDYGSGGGGSAAGQVAGAGAPGCVEIYL